MRFVSPIDASFRAVPHAAGRSGDGIESVRAHDEPVQLLTGPGHALAGARSVAPSRLAGHRIWMPGLVTGTEWGTYYDDLAAAFDLTIGVPAPASASPPFSTPSPTPRRSRPWAAS
jgi:hypothetical protein